MNVKKLNAGAWLEVDPVDEKIGKIKLLVMPIPTEYEAPADVKGVIEKTAALISDWNLTDGDTPIICNEETKKLYVPFLLRIEVKDPTEEKGKTFLGAPLMQFAANIENFLKN